MKNKEEENIERIKELLVERWDKQTRILRDSKYGQFVIQTNEVQLHLISLIFLRTTLPSKKLKQYLERLTLGNLINCFRICVKNSVELSLTDDLETYNEKRNTLVHKMYTNKKLTETDCKLSIKLGEKLLTKLKSLINN